MRQTDLQIPTKKQTNRQTDTMIDPNRDRKRKCYLPFFSFCFPQKRTKKGGVKCFMPKRLLGSNVVQIFLAFLWLFLCIITGQIPPPMLTEGVLRLGEPTRNKTKKKYS